MPDYILSFGENARVLELGGGERPIFHPNMDIRAMPGVDIVADFNKPLPIADGSLDGVFSHYLMEHLSWRSIRQLISETARILRPGGKAIHFTANTWAQVKAIVDRGHWLEIDSCTLFGDQNYSGSDWVHNSHFTGWSPDYAAQLFRECGFYTVRVLTHPDCATDMIIEATKSAAEIL